MLEAQADIETATDSMSTALHLATSSGHETVVRLLLEAQADIAAIDGNGWTVLHRAASNGHEAVAKLLLEEQANVTATNNNGSTALHLATSNSIRQYSSCCFKCRQTLQLQPILGQQHYT